MVLNKNSNSAPILVWFRNDLRLRDNPALWAALQEKVPVIPVFIWAPDEEAPWSPGGASRWWLHHSLTAFQNSLGSLGSRLILRQGSSLPELRDIIKKTSAQAIFWNRRYEPYFISQDEKIKTQFKKLGIAAKSFKANLLWEPWEILNQSGNPYQVFTPLWKAMLKAPQPRAPFPLPKKIPGFKGRLSSIPIPTLKLLPKIKWYSQMEKFWQPGEAGGHKLLEKFLRQRLTDYLALRDFPACPGTSTLSPHLHWGELSPFTIWHRVNKRTDPTAGESHQAGLGFLRQLAWREFGHYLLYHFPKTPSEPLQAPFKKFPWRNGSRDLKRWQQGQTGYPLVDAGMRELWATGIMHNRVRMLAASFLVKDLLIRWQKGAEWFWDTLVDADLANNTLGWQWTAGCGADAAPFFRIFNPTTQAKKFDPEGNYIRRWIPELKNLPTPWIFIPWEAPPEILARARIQLGKDYPLPIVDHSQARQQALAALRSIKEL